MTAATDVPVDEIRFDDGSGGQAAALVARPAEPNGGGVVIAHGGYEGGKHLFVDEAVELARSGIVALAADTTFPRDGDAEAYVRAIRAAIRLQRRALDVLQADYGARALGFYGHSAGAAQGAILTAAEPRLRAVVIAAMGAGLIEQDTGIARFDPAAWVVAPGRRALLFQYGRRDDVIPRAAALELYTLAAGRKSWAEYDCGHGVDGHAPARADRLAFFQRELVA